MLIASDQPVKRLAEAFDTSRPAISQHLRILLDAGASGRAARRARAALPAAARTAPGGRRQAAQYERLLAPAARRARRIPGEQPDETRPTLRGGLPARARAGLAGADRPARHGRVADGQQLRAARRASLSVPHRARARLRRHRPLRGARGRRAAPPLRTAGGGGWQRGPTIVTWTLEPVAEGTRVLLDHSGFEGIGGLALSAISLGAAGAAKSCARSATSSHKRKKNGEVWRQQALQANPSHNLLPDEGKRGGLEGPALFPLKALQRPPPTRMWYHTERNMKQ